MGSTSPAQARIACSTSDLSLAFETLLTLVERRFPPKPKFGAENERTRHPVLQSATGARRLRGPGESTAADRDYPG